MKEDKELPRRKVLKNISGAAIAVTASSTGITAKPISDSVPDDVDLDDRDVSREEEPTLDVSAEKKRALIASYDSFSEVSTAIENHASGVLNVLEDQNVFASSDPDEFPLGTFHEKREALGADTNVEGTSVTAINQEGTDTALITASKRTTDYWVTLFVLPEIEMSYATVKDPSGDVHHIDAETEPRLIADGGCPPPDDAGGLGYTFTDCSNSPCLKGALRPGFLGTKKTEWSYSGGCTRTVIHDIGCIC